MSDKSDEHYKAEPSIWMRGLFMLIFAVFFGLAETVLLAIAVVQFLWMIFAK